MNRTVLLLGAVVTLCTFVRAGAGPVVNTEAGALAGSIDSRTQVTVFKGVPFAAPPVGDLRWREPQPVKPWRGVRDATKFGPSPMQRVHGDFLPWTVEYLVENEVSEDCLYLNVWTPRADPAAKLPVLVYIPGGAFWEGSGAIRIYDGAGLAKQGAVVVTINYRLGAFGFLAHPELTRESPHRSSGNYGLMDQLAALRWVRANIAAFGGDPARVTAWGQSAGAFSVGALLASPESKGLFQRAIADSGLSLAALPMRDLASAEQDGAAYATELGARSLAELRAIPAERLVGPNRFRPIVDGWLLAAAPNAINTRHGGVDVPVLTGYQANDASLPRVTAAADYDAYLVRTYGDTAAAELKRLYPAGTVEQMREVLREAARERQKVATFLWARARQAGYASPVYTYFFTRGVPWPQHPEYGAFHSGELPYFFDNLHVLDRPWETIDRQVARITSRYLVNFAAHGDPNGEGVPEWPRVNAARPATQELGAKMAPMPLASTPDRFEFWVRYFESQAAKAPLF